MNATVNQPNKIFLVILLFFSMVLAACNGSSTSEEQSAAPEQPTEVAQATNTPTPTSVPPTDTPIPPTNTPTPEPPTKTPTFTPKPPTNTPTPEPPTKTPTPTDTPEPTATPSPANTPTPKPPTATPTPDVSPIVESFEQALTHYEQEEWEQAIARFQEVIELAPDFGPAYEGLGYSYAFNRQFSPAVETLQKYLELVPDAENRAQIEEDIQLLQNLMASQGKDSFEVPPGKALFVFKNYSGEQWNVDIGPYFLEVPPNPPDREFTYTTLAIDPGTYTWKANSADAGNYITDINGNQAFEFTVAEGEIYGTQCCR